MESNAAVVQAEEAVDASVAAFMAALAGGSPAASGSAAASGGSRQGGRGAGGAPVAEALADGSIPLGAGAGVLGDDPLQRVVDAALDVLGGVARSEAKLAAAKALAAAVL
ncbi:hypothetical protein Q9R30_19185, partial [Arthrobacter sp. AB6]|nr:hypothetical protein [Arthrobacter sp. AB6]